MKIMRLAVFVCYLLYSSFSQLYCWSVYEFPLVVHETQPLVAVNERTPGNYISHDQSPTLQHIRYEPSQVLPYTHQTEHTYVSQGSSCAATVTLQRSESASLAIQSRPATLVALLLKGKDTALAILGVNTPIQQARSSHRAHAVFKNSFVIPIHEYHSKVNVGHFSDQSQRVAAETHYVEKTPCSNLQDVPADHYQQYAAWTVDDWSRVIKQSIKDVQPQSESLFFNQHNSNAPLDVQNAVCHMYGLLPLPNFRQALQKEVSNYDQIMIVMGKELHKREDLPEKLREISKKAFALEHTGIVGVGTRIGKSPFDIANFIRQEAYAAQERVAKYETLAKQAADTQWVEHQKKITEKNFTSDNLVTLQQHCLELKSVSQSSHDSVQFRQEFEQLADVTYKLLPEVCKSDANITDVTRPFSDQFKTGIALISPSDSIEMYGQDITRMHMERCVGNAVQQAMQDKVVATVEYGGQLHTQAYQIPETIKRQVLDATAKAIVEHAVHAHLYNQQGNYNQALYHIRCCTELKMYAHAIATGSLDYARQFSSDKIQELEHYTTDNYEHFSNANFLVKQQQEKLEVMPSIEKDLLALQRESLSRTSLYYHHVELACKKATLGGTPTIKTESYTLTAQAKDFLAQQNILPATFTQCTGNGLQQVIHKYTVDLVNQAAQLGQNSDNKFVQDATYTLVKLAHQSARSVEQGNMQCAVTQQEVGFALYDMINTLLQVGKGAIVKGGQAGVDTIANLASIVANAPSVMHNPQPTLEYFAHELLRATAAWTNISSVPDTIPSLPGLSNLSIAEQEALIKAQVEPLCMHVEQAVHAIQNMSLNEKAYNLGGFIGETLVADKVFRYAGLVSRLSLQSTQNFIKLAPSMSARAYIKLTTRCNKAAASFEQAIARQEQRIIEECFKPKIAVQAAGTDIKVPLMHFREQAVEKGGNKIVPGSIGRVTSLPDILQKHFSTIKELCGTKLKDLQHILDRHMPGGKDVTKGTSLFLKAKNTFIQAEEIAEYCVKAWKDGVIRTKKNGVVTKVYDYGKIIGFDRFGNPTSKMMIVVLEDTRRLITAYPVH